MRGTLFDILLDHASGKPLRLIYFNIEDAMNYIYDKFIGSWGMFPHHDQVPLYFMKKIYAKFVLGMHLSYMSTSLNFYGPSKGCIYKHLRACRDLGVVPPPQRLVDIPSRGIIFLQELVYPSHLRVEVRDVRTDTVHISLSSASLAIHWKRCKPPRTHMDSLRYSLQNILYFP